MDDHRVEESARHSEEHSLEFGQVQSCLQNSRYEYHSAEGDDHADYLLCRELLFQNYRRREYVEHGLHIVAERAHRDRRVFESFKLTYPVDAHERRTQDQPAYVASYSLAVGLFLPHRQHGQYDDHTKECSSEADQTRRHVDEPRERTDRAEEHHRENQLKTRLAVIHLYLCPLFSPFFRSFP